MIILSILIKLLSSNLICVWCVIHKVFNVKKGSVWQWTALIERNVIRGINHKYDLSLQLAAYFIKIIYPLLWNGF